MRKVLRTLPFLLVFSLSLHAQFTTGNIVVLQGDAVANNTTCTIIELNPAATTTQAPVSTFPVPSSMANPFRISASAGTTGYLTNNRDGTLLCLTGVNSNTSGNVNALNPRAVGKIDGSKNFTIATTYTGDISAKNQTRSATTLDNTAWFIGDQGGIYSNGTSSASPTGNIRALKAFGTTVYAGSTDITAVSTVSAPTGGSLTGLPGVDIDADLQDFYLLSSGVNGNTYDILYLVTKTNTGTIVKYSLVSGTWVSNGTYTTGFGGFGLAAKKTTGGADLFVSSGDGGTGNNSLMKCTDQTGYNQTISILTANTITLYNAPAGTIIKGVALAPTGGITPVTPTVNLSVNATAATESAATVVTVTATASAAVTGDQTVTLAVTGNHITTGDYALSGTTITIPGGATTGSVTFTIVNDTEVEDPETATLTIGSPSAGVTLGGTISKKITIADDDVSPTLMRITEYMYGGANGEFIEFTNIGNTPIDMTGWSFSDAGETPGNVSLSAYGIVQPGESVILAETGSGTFRTAWHLCNGIKVIGNNTTNLGRADEINLYDASHALIDRLTYDDQTLGGFRANNTSAWVSAAALGKNTILGWTPATLADAEGSARSTGNDLASPGKSTQATQAYDPCAGIPGAPTIDINVATTTNLLDGGIAVSPASPFAVSGVLNDPSDPAGSMGIDFTIGDDLTPPGSLTVTVASDNNDVVPTANLLLTGSGAARNLRITPAGIGYSEITITVSDGTHSTAYVLTYAASQSSSSAIQWMTGISDASAALPLDDDYMVIADDEHNLLYVYDRKISGLPVKTFDYNPGNILALTDGAPNYKELDAEAMTPSPTHAGRSYWMGSMSNSSNSPFEVKPNRDRLIAIDITGTGPSTAFTNAGYASLRQQLIDWGEANDYGFKASSDPGKDPKLIDGFDAEGMVFAPDNTTLYICFRAPLVPVTSASRTHAIIAPVQNFETWFNNGSPSGNATLGAPITLDLGGRGIRDLIRLPNGTYIIVAGSYGSLSQPAIFRWSGVPAETPQLLSSFDVSNLNAEAALPVNEAGQLSLDKLEIICDNGDDVFYDDGIAAKDLPDDNLKKFTSTLSVSSIPDVLPVKFESFTAQRQTTGGTQGQPTDVRLDWKTGLPRDAASFDVLRSANGADFSRITTVPATTMQTAYTFTDRNAPATRLYYRIQSNEYSGQHTLSTIRTVNATGVTETPVKIYPNPVTNGVFTITTASTGVKTVGVYNDAGALVQQLTFTATAKDIFTASWAKGYYLLRITLADGSVVTQKLVVQ